MSQNYYLDNQSIALKFKLIVYEQETDYLMQAKETPFVPSTLENIDLALYKWTTELQLATNTNDGFKEAPIIWLGTERAYQIKNNKELRDSTGKLKLPLITITRDSVAKDPNFKGSFQADLSEINDYRGGAITIRRRVKQDKTRNFANADASRVQDGDETRRRKNNKIVYEELTVAAPIYVTVMYTIVIRTEYRQQMNDLVSSFISVTGNRNSDLIDNDGWQYEIFIESDYTENKNVDNLAEEERMFETKVQIKTLGYLIGEGTNRIIPQYAARETRAQIRITKERVIVGDKRPWLNNDDFEFKE